MPSAPITRPGEGMRTTFSVRPAASVTPASAARRGVVDAGVRDRSAPNAIGHGDHAGRDEAGQVVDVAVGVVVRAGPRPARSPCARPAPARSAASASASVQPRLRLGLSRHWRGGQHRALAVVVERAALEHEVVARQRRAGRRGDLLGDAVVARQHVLAAPAVEAERRRAAGALDEDRPGVAQPDVAEAAAARSRRRRRRQQRAPRPAPPPRRRPSAAPARRPARPARGPAPRPRPARASRSSSQSSAWLGKPTQIARCGDHSAGTGRVMARLDRKPWRKKRPARSLELVADAELQDPGRRRRVGQRSTKVVATHGAGCAPRHAR